LEVEGCTTYELKNVGSGGLLFERLVTLASKLREFVFLIDGNLHLKDPQLSLPRRRPNSV
jgi:hypothetical protein